MFKKIVEDIKALKIQGAENIAKASIKAVNDIFLKNKDSTDVELLMQLKLAKQTLISTRPTEPALRNSLNFLFSDINENNLKINLKRNIEKATSHFLNSDREIAKIGANKIKNGMKIYTHCHSNTVISIFKEAIKQKKKFTVLNTETRPKYQGRITAEDLSKLGIKVTHYPDNAARIAIRQADMVLFGSDAVTSEGDVINKIGSGMFSEIANRYDVPVYCCTNSWKFDPKSIQGFDEEIEERNPKEVWEKPPKGIKIKNIAFEKIEATNISGIISELGIYNPNTFINEIRRFYPWMFK
ncbi:hypothetical protein C0585_01185 [Candidatus Woesearchaeota archaeon]|nr:MAG: hypothetical protein C0585_01185 [Candidatus Woesearchaeota archaeon]